MANENTYWDVPSSPTESLAKTCTPCCPAPPPIPPECPLADIEAKSGYGDGYLPGPCGYFNEVDGLYYLTFVTTTVKTAVPIAGACPPLSCQQIDCVGGGFYYISTTDTNTVHSYVSREGATFPLDAETCGCGAAVADEDEYDDYTITYRQKGAYSNAGCTVPFVPTCTPINPEPGSSCYITEHIEEDDVITTTYSDLWTCTADPKALATAAEVIDKAAADWVSVGSSAESFASVTADGDGEVTVATISTCDLRVRVTGGNSGYVRIDWVITDQDAVEVDSGFVDHTWTYDPGTPLDVTLALPSLSTAYPATVAGETALAYQTLSLTSITCTPP